MKENDKLLIAKCEDLFGRCDKYCSAVFSNFMDGGEIAVMRDNVPFPSGFNTMLFGGFEQSEKRILGVFPEWEEPSSAVFPIKCIRAYGAFAQGLTHRDYLGAVMSLGITPQKLGDIVVSNGAAHIFIHEDVARFVCDNLRKVGRYGVKTELLENVADVSIERKFRVFGAVCASDRLDATVGAAAKISRSVAAGLIESGKVKLNHRETCKVSETVHEGDILSVRGHGRYIIDKFGGETRSNRHHITIKQYDD